MSLVPVARDEIVLGAPLPWSLYDSERNVLAEQGEIIGDEARLEAVLAVQPWREFSWTRASGESDVEAAAKQAPTPPSASEGERYSFHDMRLRVGDRIQLQPPATVSQERFIVRLIGYLDNVTLLVTAPLDNGLRLPVRENDKMVARVFSSQKAFGFNSTVERVCKIPYDYLHLSFPEVVQGTMVRKSPRVRTKIITSIAAGANQNEGERRSAMIVNMSADGALVRARAQLADKGEPIRLAFRVTLHNIDAFLNINAIVRSVFSDAEKGAGEPAAMQHGVQFQDLQPNDSVILQSMIYQQMIEQPQSLV